jgi:type IV secretion system protein TrbL
VNIGILAEMMNAFIGAFSGGFDRLQPMMGSLFGVLMSLDLAYFGVMVLFGFEPVQGLLRKLLTISIWAYVVRDFGSLATAMVDSLVQAGLAAAGSTATPREALNPSLMMEGAFTATQPIANKVLNVSWYSINGTYIMFGFTLFNMMFAYFSLALASCMALVEFYMALAITGILMPFGVLAPTRFIAMKPVSYFLACGLKLMVIAFLASISLRLLGRIRVSEEPTFREMWLAMCTSSFLGLLAWIAPQRLSAGIMAGASSFGASDVVRHAQATAQVASATSGALRGPLKAGGKALLFGGAAVGAGAAAAYGAMRSAFRPSPAPAAAPRRAGTASGAIVQASPVASAVTARPRGGARGPIYDGEFVEPSAGIQRRGSGPVSSSHPEPAPAAGTRALPRATGGAPTVPPSPTITPPTEGGSAP